MGTDASVATDLPGTELFCPECGYDLRGSTGERCPECGLAIDRAAAGAASRISWVHRGRIGWWRAFWRTVWAATVRPKVLAAEAARPVSLDDALAFRRAVVWVAWTPVAVPLAGWYAYVFSFDYAPSPHFDWLAAVFEIVAVGVALAAVWLWLFLASGVASYLFHPRYLSVERQNRAVALSYYACAPFAWTPVVILTVLIAIGIVVGAEIDEPIVAAPFVLVAAGAIGAQGLALDQAPMVMLARSTQCGLGRKVLLCVGLPLAWGVLLGVVVGGLVGSWLLVASVVLTLR
jgi:hypothetical protein